MNRNVVAGAMAGWAIAMGSAIPLQASPIIIQIGGGYRQPVLQTGPMRSGYYSGDYNNRPQYNSPRTRDYLWERDRVRRHGIHYRERAYPNYEADRFYSNPYRPPVSPYSKPTAYPYYPRYIRERVIYYDNVRGPYNR
jgi:hypothetical protein